MVTTPGRPRGYRLIVLAVILVAMSAVAWSPAAALYRGHPMAWLLLGASGLSVIASLVTRRAPAALAAPVSMLLLAGYCLVTVRAAAASAHLPGSLAHLTSDALRNGVARLLGTLLPIEPRPDTVVVPVVTVWLAGLIAAEIVFRSRYVLAAYAAPVALYALALLFAGPHHPASGLGTQLGVWRALVFAALGAIGLVTSHRSPDPVAPGEPASRTSRTLARHLATMTVFATAVLLVGAAAAVPAVTAQINRDPVDVHRVTPPRDNTLDENPLIRLSGWNLAPTEPLFRSTIEGVRADTEVRIRLAVLGDYDGVTWRVGGTYRPVGRFLTPAGTRGTVTTRITIDGLDGHLVPAVAVPRTMTGVRVAEDPTTGTLLLPDGLTPGLTYVVTSTPPNPDPDTVVGSDVPSGPEVARYLRLDGTPPDPMLRLAAQLGTEASSPYERANAIGAFLSDHYRLVNDAPSGHAYPNLDFFLFGARAAGGQRGTSEQFAASFAVLGRMLGLPTRVVVGFRGRPGTSTVRGGDALAWPEVLFDHAGWVAFDPLPTGEQPPRTVEQDFAPRTKPSTPPPSEVPTPSDSVSAPASPSSSSAVAPNPAKPSTSAFTIGLISALSLVILLLVLILVSRYRRDRGIASRGSPAERIAAAWREVHIALRLSGNPAAAHLSATAVAAHARTIAGNGYPESDGRPVPGHTARRTPRLAVPPLDDLVELVNAIAFGGIPVDERDVRIARAQSHAYVAELRARRPWWRRVLWRIDPRPLRW